MREVCVWVCVCVMQVFVFVRDGSHLYFLQKVFVNVRAASK